MRELYLIAYVMVPIFLMMVLGYVIAKRKTVGPAAADQMNSMVFKYLLPVQLFVNIYTSSLREALNVKLIVFTECVIVGVFVLLNIVVPRFFPDRKKNIPMIHAMYRSNYVIFGLAVCSGFYPDQLAVPSVMAAIVVPTYNLLGVILLEKGGSDSIDLKKTLIGIVKNPLIGASVIAIIMNLAQIPIHPILLKFLQDISKVTMTVALLAIGMRFEFGSVRDNLKPMLTTVGFRLIVLPLFAVLMGILLGFRDVELMTILIVFGSPTAVATYALSLGYDVDHPLANLLVVMTTLCCVVTLFLLLLLFSHTPFMNF